jgi:beta-glucanase (GH16 family)
MLIRTSSLLLVFLSVLIIQGCKPDAPSTQIIYPTNLSYKIEVSPTTEGLVEVEATANSANYYAFEFVDVNGSNYEENPEGKASYQFSESGTYTIIIKAHATFEHYIEQKDSITVTVTKNTGGIPDTGYTTPMSYPGYTLVWQDEFNGTTLSSDWTPEIGTGNNGWGNNELQYYRAENTEVRDGYLIITAKSEPFGGRVYTSSRLITRAKKSFQYGRIDIRAALPQGKGIWPALWMLGNSFSSVGWPACGEIDIMEMVGGSSPTAGDNTIFGTVHWENNGQHADFGGFNRLSSGIYADEFHVFSIIWDATKISWYRDDIKYHEINITPSQLSEFHQQFFFIFNIAVGGNWPGSPDATTKFPQQMAVDYVRVFQK